MAHVGLNPIQAKMDTTPETSQHTTPVSSNVYTVLSKESNLDLRVRADEI